MPRSLAICLFNLPATTYSSTSRSRGVSVSRRARISDNFGLLLPKGAVFFNRHTNGCKQVFIVHGLGEEINRAAFQRLDTFWNVAMAGEKNNGRRRAFFSEGSLESKTIASHLNIKHQAARRIWIIVFKKFIRRGEGGDGEPMRAQQTRDRVANGRVVVYKKYGGAWGNSHQWVKYYFFAPDYVLED